VGVNVEVLLGAPPVETITADVIRNLTAPDGSKPCGEGLRAGLKWIGNRALSLPEAVREARESARVREYVAWAMAALGYGDGDGYGYGDGDGSGYGYGSGYGSVSGYGDGYGYGDGDGYGSGYGDGST
jgi:hypothetical protein